MNIHNMCDYVPHERILFELGAPIQKVSRRAKIVNHGRNRVYYKSEGAVRSQRLYRLLYVSYGKEAY
jgi:hypothetical protein